MRCGTRGGSWSKRLCGYEYCNNPGRAHASGFERTITCPECPAGSGLRFVVAGQEALKLQDTYVDLASSRTFLNMLLTS